MLTMRKDENGDWVYTDVVRTIVSTWKPYKEPEETKKDPGNVEGKVESEENEDRN